MARLARLTLPNFLHYVVLKADPAISLVPTTEDVAALFSALSKMTLSAEISLHAYCILPDEIHMVLNPHDEADALGKGVQTLARLYCRYFNDAYGRGGTIWKGRFASSVLAGQQAEELAVLWTEWLPEVRGVSEAHLYPWSSYPHHAGIRSDSFVMPDRFYWALGNTPFERQRAWKRRFEQDVPLAFGQQLLCAARRGWPVGERQLLEEFGVQANRIAPVRGRGRPRRSLPPAEHA